MMGQNRSAALRLVEYVTAGLLLLVIAALGWIVLAAYQPETARLATPDMEVIVVVTLIVLTLVLVSVLALWHTGKSDESSHKPTEIDC